MQIQHEIETKQMIFHSAVRHNKWKFFIMFTCENGSRRWRLL